jgi:hypothetical protein
MLKISKNRILFGAYIITITVFFLYYLFPSESLRGYCAYRLSQISPDTRINIKDIKLAFPPGFRLSYEERWTPLNFHLTKHRDETSDANKLIFAFIFPFQLYNSK